MDFERLLEKKESRGISSSRGIAQRIRVERSATMTLDE
jgi:hypothetical protein